MKTRMNWAAGLAFCVVVSAAFGQSTQPSDGAEDSSSPAPQQNQTNDSKAQTWNQPNTKSTQYEGSLDGSGLIPLDHSVSSRFLLGGTYSAGYDTRPGEVPGAPGSGVTVLNPYLGVQVNRESTQYIFQYAPTLTYHQNNRYQGGSLHLATAKMTGELGERWAWEAHGFGLHGLDSVRLLAAEPTVPVGDVPGIGSGAASYQRNAGTTTYVDVGGRLSYKLTPRDAVTASAANAYGQSSSSVGDSIVASFRGAYSHDVSESFHWVTYGEMGRYYGALHCYIYGGGVGLTWQPGPHSFLQISGGPAVDSPACGRQQNLAYRVGYSARITERSQVYLMSSRETAGIYVGPGLWEQTLTAGYQRNLTPSDSLNLGLGYVKETLYSNVHGYSGRYASLTYSHKLPMSLRAAFSYRYFDGGWSGVTFNRNIALVSLTWTPTGERTF